MKLSEWNALVVETLKDGGSHNFEMFAKADEVIEAWIDVDQIVPADARPWSVSPEMPGWEWRETLYGRREYRERK